jgi:flagellar biosynthesis/type III secretory pathway protein FliH
MSLSNTRAGTGTQNGKCQILEMESFDMPDSSPATEAPGSAFVPVYAGSGDDDRFRSIYLFDDREKANGIVKEAHEKASLIESEAYEKGFAQGEKDGFEMGGKKLEKILDRIQGALEDIVAYRQEFIKRYEKEILHLICSIAEKVVRGAAKVDNRIARETILEAFSLAVDRSEVTVRVNPENLEYVKEIRPEFFDRISELKSITVESDPSVSRGGCVMETAFGSVDARLETQLEKITKTIEQAFEEERVEIVKRMPDSRITTCAGIDT